MIQRQQSLWLLLAAAASLLSFLYPFYAGNKLEGGLPVYNEMTAGSNFFLLILSGACLLIGGITIFLFKDRKTQLKLSLAGTALSIILLILYFTQVKKFANGNFALTAIFAFIIPVAFIMAARGIWKDEKLVKSLDKLR